MKILDKEIEFDFFDAEQMEKWDKYSEEVKNAISKIDFKNAKQSEFIRKFCTVIENCFDNIFGEGTSKEIFKGKQNFRLCVLAYKDLVNARKQQDNEIVEEIKGLENELKEINDEYRPNRATRRAKK